jgi:cytochrome c-type biogenesis protein CcmH
MLGDEPMTGRRRILLFCWLATACIVLIAGPARAVTPDEMLPDAALEARARDISQMLRCVVCQNQSIDDSNAPLAHDLRVLVRERLAAGDTDPQTIEFIVARYGNFVLLKPPMQANTLLLWFGPALFVMLAAFGLVRYLRSQTVVQRSETAKPLAGDEQERLDALLNGRRST